MCSLIPIYCQEKCPIGKHCCFGQMYADSIRDKPVRERHKCDYPKQTGMKFVDTETSKPAA